MKKTWIVAAVVLLAPAAYADDWDAYNQWWMNRYYSFDPTAFTSISCDVSNSLLDDETTALLAAHPAVKAGKAIYKTSVDNAGHIQISDPTLELAPATPSASVEVPLVKEMVEAKYRVLAETNGHDIKAIIDNFTPPDRKNTTIDKFVLDKDGSVVTRRDLDDGAISTVTVRGADLSAQTAQHTTIAGMPAKVQGTVKVHFEMVDGKYIPISNEQDVMQEIGPTRMHLLVKETIDYQFISGIRFPKTAEFDQEPGSTAYGYDETIEFKDCKVTK